MGDLALVVRKLTKQYKAHAGRPAVDGISFELKKGEILGFLGPNGSGKTTTIQMLLGTLASTSGEICYFGKDFARNRHEALKHISFASTYYSLPYLLTVRENLDVIGYLYGFSAKESRKRFFPLLERFQMEKLANRKVASLSAGQVTRLMVIKAFFVEPRIVLLDEPTASLDPEVSQDICAFLLEKREETQLSILFTSHKMEEVAQVCDRVIFLSQGKIIADDLPKNLARQGASFRLRLTIGENLEKAIRLAQEKNHSFEQDGRTICLEMNEADLSLYLHQLSLAGVIYSGIQIQEPSLQDYFLKIAKRSL